MAQNIKLKIAGNEYPMVATSPEMEEAMRTAADEINRKYTSYDAKYPDKTPLDKLIIVTLNETVNRIAAQRKLAARDEGEKQLLDEMTSYLDSIDRK